MRNSATEEFITAVDRALSEIDRASGIGWQSADGTSVQPRLDKLRDDLGDLRKRALGGSLPSRNKMIAILRWVFDWVPDPAAPLVKAVSRIGDVLR